MDERFGNKIDRLVAGSQSAEDREEARKVAIEAAKPAAFAIFEEKAKEAAEFLRSRDITWEASKRVALRYDSKKKFLSSQVIQVPVFGQPISGWILYQTTQSLSRGNATYNFGPTWQAGLIMDTEGKLYSFKDDIAMTVESFDGAVEAIGSTNAYSLDRVDELAGFWEDKVTQATVRVVKGEPYQQP
jgi:hypothetical protein